MNFKILKFKNDNPGNISILALILVLLFAFLFLILGDLSRIFIVREVTKKTADSVSLAVSQNILFFENVEVASTAEMMAESNSCKLVGLEITYDEVIATVEKNLNFILLKKFYPDGCTVASSSCSKVIFPWDDHFGYCKSYKFHY